MEIFGCENYLQVQGTSYFGTVFASTNCTIGFIKEQNLQLIPFYDLYILKEALEKKYANDLSKLSAMCDKNYKKIIREIKSEYDRLFGKR